MSRGSKPGERRGGRKRGTPNKKSAAVIEAAASLGMLPHEFLCAVSQGREIDGHLPTFDERLDAAKAAAPFYAPKLANIEQRVEGDMRHRVISAEPMSEDEWLAKHGDSVAAAAGTAEGLN